MRPVWYLAMLTLCVLALAFAAAGPACCATLREEEEMGRKYAKEFEANVTLVEDQAVVERVQRIGESLAAIANEHEVPALYGSPTICKFDYKFKVVEDDDVNAFSLPGGIIYVNSGLLDVAETDDELAAVLAHEIAHAAHHHMAQLLRKQSRVDRCIALITLAGVLGNLRSRDLNNLVLGAQLLRTGQMSGYTQLAEKDADRTAIAYLAKSDYDVKAMVAFMKKLDAIHEQNPTLPLGIYQTHPAPFRRVAAAAKAMEELGIDVDTRRMRDIAFAKCVPVEGSDNAYAVVIGQKTLWQPACLDCGTTSQQRAEVAAHLINAALDHGCSRGDIRCDAQNNRILAGDTELLKLEPEDTRSLGGDASQALDRIAKGLEYAVWADWLCQNCQDEEEEQ